jgi:DNA-binding NarL/FixJ family response regulator
MVVAWEAGSTAELRRMLAEDPVDVVLMDLALGGDDDGLAATRTIKEGRDSTKVIVLSASLDWEAAAAAREAGASGYLPKDLAVVDMVDAIRNLGSPNISRLAFSDLLAVNLGVNRPLLPWRQGLTKREQEVLLELRRGRTNKEIARRLAVSTTTINKHVQQVLKKLHVGTRAQAVAMADAEAAGRPYLVSEFRGS